MNDDAAALYGSVRYNVLSSANETYEVGDSSSQSPYLPVDDGNYEWDSYQTYSNDYGSTRANNMDHWRSFVVLEVEDDTDDCYTGTGAKVL